MHMHMLTLVNVCEEDSYRTVKEITLTEHLDQCNFTGSTMRIRNHGLSDGVLHYSYFSGVFPCFSDCQQNQILNGQLCIYV